LFIFSMPVLIRHQWQLKTVVFLHWCLIHGVLSKVPFDISWKNHLSNLKYADFRVKPCDKNKEQIQDRWLYGLSSIFLAFSSCNEDMKFGNVTPDYWDIIFLNLFRMAIDSCYNKLECLSQANHFQAFTLSMESWLKGKA